MTFSSLASRDAQDLIGTLDGMERGVGVWGVRVMVGVYRFGLLLKGTAQLGVRESIRQIKQVAGALLGGREAAD